MAEISGIGAVTTGLERGSPRRWVGLAVVLTAIFVATLDNFIVFVAIPSIRNDLGATLAQAELIVAGYPLTSRSD